MDAGSLTVYGSEYGRLGNGNPRRCADEVNNFCHVCSDGDGILFLFFLGDVICVVHLHAMDVDVILNLVSLF